MEITNNTKDKEIRDYIYKQEIGKEGIEFISKDSQWINQKLYGFKVKKI